MQPGIQDQLLALILTLVMPVLGWFEFRSLRHSLDRGDDEQRLRTYRKVLIQEWTLVAALTGTWILRERPWSALGLSAPEVAVWRVALGSAIVLALVVLLVLQNRRIELDPGAREEFRRELAHLSDMLPHRVEEMRVFRGLAVTAGICEEILYRGFLIVYLQTWLPTWGAILVAAAIFGFGHVYQGISGVAKTGAVGLAMALLYLLTGSLLQAVVLHVAIDWANGQMAYRSLQDTDQPA